MTADTIHCPLCDWTYTEPPLPTGVDENTLAKVFGPGIMLIQARNQRAADTEARLGEHFKTHQLIDWLRKVTALQAQIETQQAELAMLREKEAT